MIYRTFLQALVLFSIVVPFAYALDSSPQPEISTRVSGDSRTARGSDFMIVTSNSHATKVGYEILRRGGSAADAAIAAQATLGLVEPQSSGIGGGAFVLYYDAKSKQLKTIDARETAPGLAGPFLFYKDGKPMNFKAAQLGGRSVGVPGIPKLLEHLHQAHGKLTWMELFEGAIALSENGFEVSPRLSEMVVHYGDGLNKYSDTANYFFPSGVPIQAGDILKNINYATTLKDYAFYGSSVFYDSGLADKIVDTVQNAHGNAGLITLRDLQNYQLKDRKPVCAPYRAYIVCGMGEPSSGGLTVLQTLGLLEGFDLKALGANNPESWGLIAQASALAFADRNMYMADPDFVNTPNVALLDPQYINERRKLIDVKKPLSEITLDAGKPALWDGPLYERGNSIDRPGTSHISIIDKQGNILSMTTTIESAFGSHLMVGGFMLNNELTDFSFTPFGENGELVANMVEGGKRPRSSMAPTIVFDLEGNPVLVIGSAGGSRIIGYVLQRIIAVLDWGMSIDQATAMPHILARSETIEFERQNAISNTISELGNNIKIDDLNSGLTAIQIRDDTYIGAADPRREGMAQGQ